MGKPTVGEVAEHFLEVQRRFRGKGWRFRIYQNGSQQVSLRRAIQQMVWYSTMVTTTAPDGRRFFLQKRASVDDPEERLWVVWEDLNAPGPFFEAANVPEALGNLLDLYELEDL